MGVRDTLEAVGGWSMAETDAHKQVRELAHEVAATTEPSFIDWSFFFTRHYQIGTDWEQRFEQVAERSERSRKELADEFARAYNNHKKLSGGP